MFKKIQAVCTHPSEMTVRQYIVLEVLAQFSAALKQSQSLA